MKNPPCQSARRVSRKLCQLFSSFLRGASCPKSPRVAATAALSLMPESVGESQAVSGKGSRSVSGSSVNDQNPAKVLVPQVMSAIA